ncbi:alpha/beta hydrolase [bacterium]|nr:alpha/beta hydrolase [bacterium]
MHEKYLKKELNIATFLKRTELVEKYIGRRATFLLLCWAFCLPSFCSAETNVKSGYADVQAGRIFYEVSGNGLPVVLIHGGFMDHRMWDDQMPVLSKNFKVIRFDVRGFGKSSKPDKEFYPSKDLAQLLDFLKIPDAAVVGLSLGGWVAIDFALSNPERVRALIIAEPGVAGHQWSKEVMDHMDAVMSAEKSHGRDAAIEVLLNGRVFATAKQNPAVFERLKAQVINNFDLSVGSMMRTSVKDAIHQLSKIQIPVFLIQSEHAGEDAVAIAKEFQKQVKQIKIANVSNSGHMMNMEQPQQFNQLVGEFLKKR